MVDGTTILKGIAFTLPKYKQKHGLDTFAIREAYPSLDALEDAIVNWQVAGYEQRSALQVMPNMDCRRRSEQSHDSYAMIGSGLLDVAKTP